MVLYSPYVVVNKTGLNLVLGMGGKRNDLEILGNETQYFNPRKETKLFIKAEDHSWSKEFSIKTPGVSGEVSLKANKSVASSHKYIREYNSSEIDFGVRIATLSSAFYKTVAITIAPRFVLCNKCSESLIIMNDERGSRAQHMLNKNEEKIYYFENKSNGENLIKFRTLLEEEKEKKICTLSQVTGSTQWSHSFGITDISDFQAACGGTEEHKSNKWYLPSSSNGYRRYVRVMITTQDEATIFVVFSDPGTPDCIMKNDTKKNIRIKQSKIGIWNELEPKQEIPFIWDDEVEMKTDRGGEHKIKIDKIDKVKAKKGKWEQIEVEAISSKKNKEVIIRDLMEENTQEDTLAKNQFEYVMQQKLNYRCIKLSLDLKSVCISIINSQPKEVLLVAVHKPFISYNRLTSNNISETQEIVDVLVDHFQIDNMVSWENPVLLCPKKVLHCKEEIKEEKKGDGDEYTPFVQLKIEREMTNNNGTIHTKFPCLLFSMQEILVKVDTKSLDEIMKIFNRIVSVFSLFDAEYRSSLYVYEKNLRKNTRITLSEEEKKEMGYKSIDKYSPQLENSCPSIINEPIITAERNYFEFVNIGAMKIVLTVQIEHKYMDLDYRREGGGLNSVGYTLISNVASMSDTPLWFKELIITHTYTAPENLADIIVRNFIRQGAGQFYKFIGSSDILGNPVGFVNKLGTGVYEFINEPKKGLVKGPKHFVGGVGKGVKSLVGGLTTASLDSFSKITGSLYNTTKDIAGQKIEREKAPDNVAKGVYKGAKGGLKELGTGVSGLFTQPVKYAKKDGVGGFFVGMGKGLLGAAASPFSATLKAATNVSQGLNSTTSKLIHGRIEKQGRYRHPRYISPTGIIQEYNEQLSEAKLILENLRKGRYSDEAIHFIAKYYKFTKKSQELEGVFIITNDHIIYCKDLTKIIFKCKRKDITEVEKYTEGMDMRTGNSIHHLRVKTRKKKERVFTSHIYLDTHKAEQILKS